MRVLVLDNGDTCLGNLVDPLRELGAECDVRPSGSLGLDDIRQMTPQPQRILMTPGPGRHDEAGACQEVVTHLAGLIPILGVGLGLQVLAHAAQGRLIPPRETRSRDGCTTTIRHDEKNLFAGLSSPFDAPRGPAPSLVLDARRPGNDLEASAWDEDGTVVGCRVWALGMEGIQVDTRWFATRLGKDMLFNFLYQSQAW
jgi:anthranilate synthase/aminodeoxychorismate synthase-like glutamine amidotransferase